MTGARRLLDRSGRLMRLLVVLFAADLSLSGAVKVEICEQGLGDKDSWPEVPPVAAESFEVPAFALDQLPPKYVEDGIRGTRPSPSLVRLSGSIELPAGRHRFLIRSRSAARLSVGGRLVVQTPFAPKNGGDGSQSDTERLMPLDLGEGYRFAPGGEYERKAEFESEGGRFDVVFEAFAGGREGKSPRRVELGETVVAVAINGGPAWMLLAPGVTHLPYTNGVWSGYSTGVATMLAERNARTRAALRERNSGHRERQRGAIDEWLRKVPDIVVPALPEGFTANNPIDHFIAAKFIAVKSQNHHAPGDSVDFFRDVKPLLESRCVECHRGEKAKGGLRLESLALASKGGDSGAAIVPRRPEDGELLRRVMSRDTDEQMPPKGARLSDAETAVLSRWISEGAAWPDLPVMRNSFAEPVDDAAFIRRAMLDTVGVPPTAEELRAFLANTRPDKRGELIDRLLSDARWADHWMPFWQDLLAENPNILNPTLNNTGPFRWWIYEALVDDLSVDQMVRQLVLQRGGSREGGPAGFSEASQNDAPFAAKGTIVSATFLGVDLKCARCHDSPTGAYKQEQLFQLGALLAAKPLDVPKTSSVDPAKLHAGGRKALIEVTLSPGTTVQPKWPFAEFVAEPVSEETGHRERLAALLVAPQNERFAQVMVNRVWQRFMGRGIVEPLDDWEKGTPTHPELLRWLGREFVRNGYSVKSIARMILNSSAYQRAVDPNFRTADPLYAAAEPRRLSAEQVVDSLFSTTGKPFRMEALNLDVNGRRDTGNSINLGVPRRAWMLASLSNERDRPSLTLPRLQAVFDALSALGWRGSRQDPASTREVAPNALQPAILGNGVMSHWLTRLSDDHGLEDVALSARTVDAFVEELFVRLLSRLPSEPEAKRYTAWLSEGFAARRVENPKTTPLPHVAPKLLTWTNHLQPESDAAAQERIDAAQKGEPPTPRLEAAWRARCEDAIWAIINSPEMLYRP
jgi:hypothetical protein